MRYVIYGAGAIGGTIGARLHLAGFPVLLIARGAHLEAIRSRGLHFASPTQDVRLEIPAVGHPREADLTSEDVVMLGMKSQHTEGAIRDLYAVADDAVPVICCQNGVVNERIALRRFANTYGMVVHFPAEHLEPGSVVHYAEVPAGVLDAGRYPSGVDARITDVTAALERSGFRSRPDPDIMRLKYAKLLGNLNNAVQAACGEVSPEIARVLRDEALACYVAAGIECAAAEEVRARWQAARGGEVSGRVRRGGSSMQSVLRGAGDIEADYLNGEIVQLGRLHGVDTPANAVVQRVARRMVRERLEVGAFTIGDLEALIGAAGA
jgi:2-dehydropantoate 2-reductase